MKHSFTETIISILREYYGERAQEVLNASELLGYLNQKTVSANRGSKSRGSFGNIYSVYVLVEDYLKHGYDSEGDYSKYEGARFSDLFKRQRELPFGKKLQNHALNHRMNQEFKKYYPTCEFIPIIRVADTSRYWINNNLMNVDLGDGKVNIAEPVIKIIDAYVDSKRSAFESFIATCEELKSIDDADGEKIREFVHGLLQPNVDARIFEIVSYAILKADYGGQTVFFGFTEDAVAPERLKLYKTGRTNANDGGIDFVMKPLGRFFQVTETTDVKKYFLDIDKLEKFPITFVVKSEESSDALMDRIKTGAQKQYSIEAVVTKYMACVEEIINLGKLKESFEKAIAKGKSKDIIGEIVKQSKVEFNIEEEE